MDDRQELVSAAQAVAKRLGVTRLTFEIFRRETGIHQKRVYQAFESWPALCVAAGLSPGAQNARVDDEAIFTAMDKAFLVAGGVCTLQRLLREVPFSDMVVRRRFGTWPVMLSEFRRWARAHVPDAPYMAALDARLDPPKTAQPRQPAAAGTPSWPARGGRLCGAPIDLRGLLFAPVNESGVVMLFGMVAAELGYRVETVATGFPDCTARRHVGGGRWESVAIEFEYRSRSFRDHGHDAAGCDIVVCWEHDWAECPLEVLALNEAVDRLRDGQMA